MPVPTLTAVSPAFGPPTGGHLVELTGTNFRLPTPPAATGPVPPRPIPVRVTFDGIESPRVLVISDTRLMAETPKRLLVDGDGRPVTDPLAVDVVVENVDDDGVLIPTETVTLADGYEYRRIDLSFENPSDLSRMVDRLLDLFTSEVLPNTISDVNTDFDSSVGDDRDYTEVAELPAVVLTGPQLSENTFYRRWVDPVVELSGDEFREQRRPKYNDLTFDVLVITDNQRQLINLIALIDTFMDNNKFVDLDDVRYEMDFVPGSDMAVLKQSNNQLNSNIRTAKGQLLIRGFNMFGFAGVENHGTRDVGARVADDVTLGSTEQTSTDLPASHGAGLRSPGDS